MSLAARHIRFSVPSRNDPLDWQGDAGRSCEVASRLTADEAIG